MTRPALQPILAAALAAHQAGRLDEAAAGYARVLADDPDDLNAVYLSGMVALQRRDFAAAAAAIGRAVAAKPDHADLQNNLGEALRGLRRLEEAEAAYRRALALKPDHAGAIANLAILERGRGALAAASAGFERALALEPERADHHSNLAGALFERGDLAPAERHYRRALELDPGHARACAGLAAVLRDSAREEQARALLEAALARMPGAPLLLSARADLAYRAGALAAAAADCHAALAALPEDADCHTILGNIAMRRGDVDGALAAVDRWIGCVADTAPRTRALARSARLFHVQYASSFDGAGLAREHAAWAAACAPSIPPSPEPRDRDPARRLRVGFVSPDFRTHSVATFFEPTLAAFDRAALHVTLYADVPRPDATTARLRARADEWRPIQGRTDEEIAAQIRADAIDVLVDLTGHTADNRLLVFARRPAPVQATWLGYPGTTGLSAIDWRISDAVCDPPEDDARSAERVLRLPGFHCFAPPPAAPAVAPLPARAAPFTFGSFNNATKISEACARAFAGVLAAAPGSRLLLKSSTGGDAETRQGQVARIAVHGIDPARIEFLPHLADPADHLGAYGRIDLALDTFPYNGTTTTCEALWMGVPVLTLKGDRHAARVGASLLGQLGLDAFVAHGVADFVARAAAWPARADELAALRGGLRARMAASPLCDAPAFARSLEGAFRLMWRARLGLAA